jgi:hypothetical protein
MPIAARREWRKSAAAVESTRLGSSEAGPQEWREPWLVASRAAGGRPAAEPIVTVPGTSWLGLTGTRPYD